MSSKRCRPRRKFENSIALDLREFLLDLGFAEFDGLLADRIVFLLDELVGHGARVLARHVVEASVGAGNELDLNIGGLGHGQSSIRGLADNLVGDVRKSRKPGKRLKLKGVRAGISCAACDRSAPDGHGSCRLRSGPAALPARWR